MNQTKRRNTTTRYLLISLIFFFTIFPVQAETVAVYLNKVADAIYWAEGGKKAKHPYGLIYYHIPNHLYRDICLEYLNDYYTEWLTERNTDFLTYLASKWAPIKGRGVTRSASKLNRNWLKNVRYFVNHPKPIS